MRRIVALALLVASDYACSGKSNGRSVRVAAASDLARAFEDVGKHFESKTGITPVFDFGSSGLLAKQIAEGAPFALFAAANREYIDQVVASGRCDAGSVSPYARGRIVVWTPSPVPAPTKLADLADPRFERIAIANPEHAPYGKAAKQALEHAGLWDKLANRIVFGDSVQATMQYAQSHAVQAAVVAWSLAVVTDGGASLPIDATLYDPLEQSLVVCGGGESAEAARELVAFLATGAGREIMTRYGFSLPSEQAHGR